MEKTINILEGTEARIEGFKVFIKGKNGNLERDFFSPLFKNDISLERSDNTIKVSTKATKKKIKAEVGTIAAHIKNMLKGVTDGYTYKLKIIYMHFPITVKVSSKDILISNFLGEKQPRRADIVDGCKVDMIFELNTLNLIPNSDKSTVKNQILDKIDSFIGDNFLSLVLSTVNTNNILCVYGFVIQTSCVNVLPAYQLGVVYPLSILYKPGSGLLTDLIWQVK